MGNWLVNAKVPVPILELCKIPVQKEKLLKILDSPTDSCPSTPLEPLSNPPKPSTPNKVTFSDTMERTSNNVFVDPLIVLHTRDPRKEDHPPFYVSLMIGHLLLHNCMLDSGCSSSIMTKTVMHQLNLKTTRPYQNVCAMDSRPVEVEGMIENHLVRLAKYPNIQITMDILVIDVPDKWGMFLSRKWGATLGGSIQWIGPMPLCQHLSFHLLNCIPKKRKDTMLKVPKDH